MVNILDSDGISFTSTIASITDGTHFKLVHPFLRNGTTDATKNCTIIGYGYKYITRYNPFRHADFEDYMYAENVLELDGDVPRGRSDQNVASFDEGCLGVNFNSPLYGILEDDAVQSKTGATYPDESSLLRNCLIEYNPTAKYQTIPPFSSIVWKDNGLGGFNGKTVSANAVKLLFEADYTVTWLDVPLRALPLTAILACAGCTNVNPFGRADAPGGVMPSGTLIAMMPKIPLPHRMPTGALAYDVTMRFKVYPQGANRLYSYETGRFEEIAVAQLKMLATPTRFPF